MSKISELSDGGVIQGGDTLIAVRSGGNVKVTYGGTTTANIDGGTIDNTVIGGTTPAAGNFTTVTADGLTVDGTGTFGSLSSKIKVGLNGDSISSDADFYIQTSTADPLILRTNFTQRQRIDSNGDISFYESTGTTPKFHWDASEERLGIGNSSPVSYQTGAVINVGNTSDTYSQINLTSSTSGKNYIGFGDATSGTGRYQGLITYDHSVNVMGFGTAASTAYQMSIDSSGALGLGTTPPSTSTHSQMFIGTESVILGSSSGALDIGNNLYYNSGWKYRTTGAGSLQDFDASGNITFYRVASGTANAAVTLNESMRIDSSGNLLVGKTSVDTSTPGTVLRGAVSSIFVVDGSVDNQVAIFNRTTNNGKILDFHKDGSTVGSIGIESGGFVIDGEAGHTGIRFGAAQIIPRDNGADTDGLTDLGFNGGSFKDLYLSGGLRGDTTFKNNAGTTEYARFDSSGNLLVGKSDLAFGTAGSVLYSNGLTTITRDGGAAVQLNRLTSDGAIQTFSKDGSTVGSIGVNGGNNLNIGGSVANHAGLEFVDTAYYPQIAQVGSDGGVDLGGSSRRFKDLYLSSFVLTDANKGMRSSGALYLQSNYGSGTKSAYLNTNGDFVFGTSTQGIYLGGTAAANKLDDYEEGTWTPADGSGAGLTFTNVVGNYTKVGRSVTVTGYIEVPTTADTSAVKISGLPFTTLSSTARSAGGIGYKQSTEADTIMIDANNTTASVYTNVGGTTKNNQLSGEVLYFGFTYFVA